MTLLGHSAAGQSLTVEHQGPLKTVPLGLYLFAVSIYAFHCSRDRCR